MRFLNYRQEKDLRKGEEMYDKYRKLRDSKGVTDYEVWKNTGIDKATLSRWKHGNYTPKVENIIKIADYFDVSLDYFYRERCAKKA